MTEIHFIYFDIGGVCIRDFSKTNKWNEMLEDLQMPSSVREQFGELYDELEPDVHRGLDCEEIVSKASVELNFTFPQNYSLLQDLVDRFEANPSLQPIITELDKKYRLGLLTNMYPQMLDLIKQKGILPKANWEVEVDSSIVGEQKPDAGIYKIAEKTAGVDPQRILFIDNTSINLEAAATRSWQTILYNPADVEESNNRILDYFNN